MRLEPDKAADAGDFEWVNAWADASAAPAGDNASAASADVPADAALLSRDIAEIRAVQADAGAPREAVHLVLVGTEPPADQLMRDVLDIEHARDALQAERLFLQAGPRQTPERIPRQGHEQTQAIMLVPSRTADTVPVFVGGVLALMMLTVFGAAAMVSKFAR
jgi:hypothetical protein